jgi:hypothetical protein
LCARRERPLLRHCPEPATGAHSITSFGDQQQITRNFQIERSGGLMIDDQLERSGGLMIDDQLELGRSST